MVGFAGEASESSPGVLKNDLSQMLPPNPCFISKGITVSGDSMNEKLQPVGELYIEYSPDGTRLPTKWYTINGYLLNMGDE